LDLNFYVEDLTSDVMLDEAPADMVSHVQSNYMPNNGFFDSFESQGGVQTFIKVAEAALLDWKNQDSAKKWKLWLQEISSFAEIPSFFKTFIQNRFCKDLLFKVLSGEPDKDSNQQKWESEQKEAV
jgi:ubiquitin-activating enzyme E1